MAKNPYVVAPMPKQIPQADLDRLAMAETATIGHLRDEGFVDRAIQCLLKPAPRIVGTAVTVSIPAMDSTLLHHAMGLLRPGDVLVVDRLGDDRHACLGGGVAFAAKVAGAVAAIVDGPCTDLSEIEECGLPVWCRGISPVTTRLLDLGGAMNRPVTCGGVVVRPGDAILADESGVLVLSPGEVAELADIAVARQERGLGRRPLIAAGSKMGELSGATEMVRARLVEVAA